MGHSSARIRASEQELIPSFQPGSATSSSLLKRVFGYRLAAIAGARTWVEP
jgi:hypothetical protein